MQDIFTLADHVRYAVSRFNREGLFYGHGTDNAFDEAVFIVMEALHLPPETELDPFWNCRLTEAERKKVQELIEARATTRKPAPYLLNKAYIQGIPFYVDARVIVPRSYIGEILTQEDGFAPPGFPQDVRRVLDLCTGSGCLAILAALVYPDAQVDAVDLSPGALDVARKNVETHGLEGQITLHEGDLFTPVAGNKYDLIIANPPYVTHESMESLPPEYRHEPEMALASGEDGLDAVRQILAQSRDRLNEPGGLLCEIGNGRDTVESAFPETPFLWLDTAESEGAVFWVNGRDI